MAHPGAPPGAEMTGATSRWPPEARSTSTNKTLAGEVDGGDHRRRGKVYQRGVCVLGGAGAHRSGRNRPATEAATVGIERVGRRERLGFGRRER
jgi:hypothetical protein